MSEERKTGGKFGGNCVFFFCCWLVVRNLRIEEGGGKGGGGSAGGITEFAEAASGTLRIRGFSGGVLRISATREEASSFGGL